MEFKINKQLDQHQQKQLKAPNQSNNHNLER